MARQVAKWRLILLILIVFIHQDLINCSYFAPASAPTPSYVPPRSRPPPPPPPPIAPAPPPPFDPSGGGGQKLPGGPSKDLSGGQKAGIAIGVIAAAGAVALGATVYKKRRRNIRRARLGSAARRAAL